MTERATLLIVDDTAENLDVLTGLFKGTYQVKAAKSGKVAIKLAQMTPQPDLILLDIMMPDIDGYQVCKLLKEHPNTAHIPIIFVTAKISPADEIKGLSLGAVDYITKPVTPAVAIQRVQTQLALYDQKKALYLKVKEQTSEINLSKVEMVKMLGRAAEYKDNETGMHVLRMSHYCHVLALASGMPLEDADLLREAAPMHDIGKIGIPDCVLLKPGKLGKSEWETMQTHVNIGVDILGDTAGSKLLEMAVQVAQNHHEKWNGHGYPQGLSGEQIPLVARIAAIADVFDALTSDRPYKEAWSLERTIALLKEEKGQHFDPNLVTLFLNNLDEILAIQSKFKD
ncbi:HD domain-containing phosphohydrolase [Vibrio genomosp. F10]|uniref:HD domain-containing phosphohydrolase n=1 Tax=Vibrio genomosp. F10 TaxID=723171 RepID=UPI0002F6305F|nr:HD domain-containing phosphohydrolase [Vibrio genomosp. F10]OEE99378.1 two-component system response regulator [Vibrio genomosp. F10 str. 9ZD137]OEF10523.1 two-component system response regulator [Vibrio genomosp. F10 str. 9ZB36]